MARQPDVEYIRFYTSGSAAQQLKPAFPETEPVVKPAQKKAHCKRIYVDPVALFGIVVAVCMLIAMAVGMIELRQMQHRAENLDLYVQQLSAENKALTEEFEAGYNIAEVEQTALALGMVPAEEIPRQTLSVHMPEEPAEESFLTQLTAFLTGLFA